MAIGEVFELEYDPGLRLEVKVGLWLSVAFTGFLVSMAVFVPPDDPMQNRCLWGLMGGMTVSIAILLWCRRLLSLRLIVSPEGVSLLRDSREVVFLSWREITGLRCHRLFGWVEIESPAPEKRIRVDPNLAGFSDFVAILEAESGITLRVTW